MDQQHSALDPAYRSREAHRVAAQRIGRCAAARGPLGMRHHRFDVIELPAQRSSASTRAPRWACSRRSAPAIRCSADSGPTPGAGRRQRPWCSPVATTAGAGPARTARSPGCSATQTLRGRCSSRQPLLVERDVELAVKMMLDHMAECLAGGGRIEIWGFGSFTVRFRHARVGRNPRTGTVVSLPARCGAYFKPRKKLRERVDRESRGPAEAQPHASPSENPRERSGQ